MFNGGVDLGFAQSWTRRSLGALQLLHAVFDLDFAQSWTRRSRLGQVSRLRCSEAVREGLEAEKRASQRESGSPPRRNPTAPQYNIVEDAALRGRKEKKNG
ncbi:unnamed protein product [Linum trigynum]|uniref:Uncharacterized protein n=1 Tax=Linum trigynum TaxID=586398 RepID=A0AAV2D1D0_9ROSI